MYWCSSLNDYLVFVTFLQVLIITIRRRRLDSSSTSDLILEPLIQEKKSPSESTPMDCNTNFTKKLIHLVFCFLILTFLFAQNLIFLTVYVATYSKKIGYDLNKGDPGSAWACFGYLD